jgi:DNA-binding NtrC family response regulator
LAQRLGVPSERGQQAREALEAMLVAPADIVLCDIKMPGHDGLWLVEKIRQRWPRSVTIMTTAVMDVDAVVQSQRSGAVDYVTKPFGRKLLLQALARATTKAATLITSRGLDRVRQILSSARVRFQEPRARVKSVRHHVVATVSFSEAGVPNKLVLLTLELLGAV